MASLDAAFVTVVLGALAVLSAATAWVASRRVRALLASVERAERRTDRLLLSFPHAVARYREQMAAVNAGAERALWSLERLDERATSATTLLERRRLELDRQRRRMLEAHDAFERLRSMVGMVMRAMELRRTILG